MPPRFLRAFRQTPDDSSSPRWSFGIQSLKTREEVYGQHREEIENLKPLAWFEVTEFVEQSASHEPMVQPESLSVAVKAVIQFEKTRSGAGLLEALRLLSGDKKAGEQTALQDPRAASRAVRRVVYSGSAQAGAKRADAIGVDRTRSELRGRIQLPSTWGPDQEWNGKGRSLGTAATCGGKLCALWSDRRATSRG